MQLRCQSCETELHAADVDFESLDARCRHCGWRFGRPNPPYRTAGRVLETDEEPADADDLAQLAALGSSTTQLAPAWPRGVEVRRNRRRGQLALTIASRPPRALVKAAAVVVAVFLFGTVQIYADTGWGGVLWRWTAAVAALALYAGLAWRHNRVTLRASPEGLGISPGPLPWFGNRAIPRAAVQQLWVAVIEASVEGEMRRYYELRARTPSGDIELVTEIESPVAALYLEREIEEHLGIADEMIHGQYRPRVDKTVEK